jgi:hypothetical protein
MSVFKGRPIHHYAGHDEQTMRDVFGLDDGEIEEVLRRLSDVDYDREVEADEALRADLVAQEDPNAWVHDPLRPVPGAPEVYITSTIGGPRTVAEQLEEARITGEIERREELAKERDEAEKQGEEDRRHVAQRTADAEVRAMEAEIALRQRRLEVVKEHAAEATEEPVKEEPIAEKVREEAPRRQSKKNVPVEHVVAEEPRVPEPVREEPREPRFE